MIGPEESKALSSTARQIIFWVLIIAGALLIYKLVNPGSKNTSNIDLVQLYQRIDSGDIKQISIKATETVAIDSKNGTEYHIQLTNEPAKNDLIKYAKDNNPNTSKPRVEKVED